jgi:heme/copper-type cytochrome/quinol oxidase subunit 3
MKRIIYHVLLPAILPLSFFAVAYTPVDVFGCRGRGLIALTIALISGIGSLATAILSVKRKKENHEKARWWLLSAIILAIPVVGMLILA